MRNFSCCVGMLFFCLSVSAPRKWHIMYPLSLYWRSVCTLFLKESWPKNIMIDQNTTQIPLPCLLNSCSQLSCMPRVRWGILLNELAFLQRLLRDDAFGVGFEVLRA